MNCPHCGTTAPSDARFCPTCGKPTASSDTFSHPRETLLLAAIGPRAEHYLPNFLAREEGSKGAIGWHWPAFFVTFFWMLHRKMYGLAFVYLAIAIVLAQITAPILVATLDSGGALLAGLIYLGLAVLPALYAGTLYHRHCRKVIAFTQRYQPDPQRQLRQIELSGGTGGAAVPLIILFASVPLLGILAAIALPAYQDYTARAATSAAYSHLTGAGAALGSHYKTHGRLPSSLEDAGFSYRPTQWTSALNFDNDGVLSVTLAQPTVFTGKTLQLLPTLNEQGELIWSCRSTEIQDKLLPRPCRADQS